MDVIYKEFKPIFKQFPFIEKISWEQYTPYNLNQNFQFRIKSDSIKINNNYITPLFNLNLRKKIDNLFNNKSINQFKDKFGDHVSVTINKDSSIIIKECYHE